MEETTETTLALAGLTIVASPQAAIERIKLALDPLVKRRMTELSAEVAPLAERAATLPAIATKQDADSAGVLLTELAGKRKAIEAERLATTRPLDSLKTWVMGLVAPIAGDLDQAEATVRRAIKVYQAEQQRIADEKAVAELRVRMAEARAKADAEAAARRAEEERRQAEAKAEADRRAAEAAAQAKQDAERLAAQAASDDEADRIRQQAEAEAEAAAAAARRQAQVDASWADDDAAEAEAEAQAQAALALAAAAVPTTAKAEKIAGAGMVEHWSFEVLAVAKVPREYLIPDEKAIRAAIKGGARDIPGIRIFRDDIVRAR